jgi:hypothetical protein
VDTAPSAVANKEKRHCSGSNTSRLRIKRSQTKQTNKAAAAPIIKPSGFYDTNLFNLLPHLNKF